MLVVHSSILLHLAFVYIYFTCGTKGSYPTSENVTGIAGGSLLLNCTIGPDPGQVTWMRPGDNAIVSRGYSIVNGDDRRVRNRLMVVGDFPKGEFHLLIRYALFPQDAGTWMCSSESVTRKLNVVLLVRPNSEVPNISPSYSSRAPAAAAAADADSQLADGNDLRTFTCTAQFAFPPVQLTWVKEFGPDAPYHVTLPSIVVSRSGTMSSSVKLILSGSNNRSLFVCIASHPTFFGKVHLRAFQFNMPQGIEPQPLVQKSHEDMRSLSSTSLTRLDLLDRVFLLLVIAIILIAFGVGILMSKCHTRWQLDVPQDRIDRNLNTKALCDVIEGEEAKRRISSKSRDRFARKVLLTLILLMLLVGSLVFAFPIYFKGVTVPAVDADEIASVMAGSALWLDCRGLVQPPTSVLQIDWLYNGQPFYHQYYLNTQNVGFPHNSTKGFVMGIRVSSQGLGQVTLWPVAPGEDGQYACRVFVSSGDDGVTEERGKTTAVFVLMGPIVNYGLIGLLALALVSSVGLFVLFVYHCLRIPRKEEVDRLEDEDV